ncbi:MAG: 4Fe-4S dicluster domain-containing protein [Thermoanaerobaculia bacterium]
MSMYGFLVDLRLCISCKACEAACKTLNEVPTGRDVRYRRVIDQVIGVWPRVTAYSVSMACNHCEDAPCVKACTSGALSIRAKDGIVLLDRDKCVGCRYCESVCPYGAPQYDAAEKKMSKCLFCVARIDAGLEPACVDTCPTGALQFGKLDDIDRLGVKQIPNFAYPAYSNPSIRFVPKEG